MSRELRRRAGFLFAEEKPQFTHVVPGADLRSPCLPGRGRSPLVQPDRLGFDLPPGERDGRRPRVFAADEQDEAARAGRGQSGSQDDLARKPPAVVVNSNCRVGSANVVGTAASVKVRPSEGGWPAGTASRSTTE